MCEVLVSALVLGLSAGTAPGPLMTLVLSQTLRHGAREGCKTAMAPLVTDVPVILLSLLMTAQFSQLNLFLAVVSMAGGAFVMYLAWESCRPPKVDSALPESDPQSWRKGIATNLLSPNPWLFWFTVGAATLTKASRVGWPAVALFLLIFYLLLCGGKASVAMITGKFRAFLTGRIYRGVLCTLGFALAAFALLLFRDGWNYGAAWLSAR